MAAPTFDSVTKAATQAQPTVSQDVKAYSLWAKIGPVDGAKAMGRAQIDFLKMAQRGAAMHLKAFQKALNV